jgi:hypothetical protein
MTLPSLYIYETILFVKNNVSNFETSKLSNLRTNKNLHIPTHNTTLYQRNIYYNGIKLYNKLPKSLKEERNLKKFKKNLKSILLNGVFYKVEDFFEAKF